MENLTILAGKSAENMIRDGGLKAEAVRVVAGAAGGPKWLVLSRLDRAIFGEWFKYKTAPLFLIGSSIGAWRFSALAQHDLHDAIERFESGYLSQTYSDRPTPEEISRETIRIQNIFINGPAVRDILTHPYIRLNVMANRCKGPTAGESKPLLYLGFITAACLNLLGRRLLGLLFERTLFYDPRDRPPFWDMNQFPIQRIPLTVENLKPALVASGSIPLVMKGVTDIPGTRAGVYRDGGILDYHMDVPFLTDDDGLVLFPHFMPRIIPGWLDKSLRWRKPRPEHVDRVVLISPSPAFIDGLPYGKIPDRTDFYTFKGRNQERIAYWRKVIDAGRRLGDEFLELVSGDRIKKAVKPLFK
jgi:hypothetical protein